MKLGKNLIRASGLSSRLVCVATCPCSMLIFRKQPSNLPQISAFLWHLREPWLYPFKKSPYLSFRSSPWKCKNAFHCNQKHICQKWWGECAAVGREAEECLHENRRSGVDSPGGQASVWSFDHHFISPTDHCPWAPLATVYLPVCTENQLLGSQ